MQLPRTASSLQLTPFVALLLLLVPVFGLKAQERTFGEVTIQLRDIFEDPQNALYRTANNLKVMTREVVIRRELLFKEGAPFDPFLVEESERVLRELRFLRDVSLEQVPNGNEVDIIVHAQETWTVIPQLSFSSGDGRTRRTIGLSESNALGYGKRVEFLFRQDEGTDSVELAYDDRNFLGGKYQLQTGIFEGNEGSTYIAEFGDPYRSLVQESAWNQSILIGDTIERLFGAGEERFVYRKETESVAFRYSIAEGDAAEQVHRLTFGAEYLSESFAEATAQDFDDVNVELDELTGPPAVLAENRRFVGPSLSYQSIEQDFISMNYIDRFSRVQDYNLGEVYSTSIFYAPTPLGSREDSFLFSGVYRRGYQPNPETFFRWEAGFGTRVTDDGFENTLGRAEAKLFSVLGPLWWGDWYLGKHTLAFSADFEVGSDFDADRELLLGADNGLRGYEARTFTGDKRLLVNLEDRMHFVENVFDLISIGGAVFAEAGGATFSPVGELISDEMFANVGFGLRFAFPRSSGERVLRVDFAVPLREAPDGSDRFELRLLFAGGQAFSSRTNSEAISQQRVGVDLGF